MDDHRRREGRKCRERGKHTMKICGSRRAFTLIELLGYMAVLAVVMTIAYVAIYHCMMGSRSLMRNSSDIVRTLKAGEKWRKDIRTALEVPVLAGDTLRVLRDSGEVLYKFVDGNIMRKLPDREWNVLLRDVKASRMIMDQGSFVDSWRWELELKARKKNVRIRPLFSFQAVAVE